LKEDLNISDEIINEILSFINFKSNSIEDLDLLKDMCSVQEYQE
jgi:hypothetical protein